MLPPSRSTRTLTFTVPALLLILSLSAQAQRRDATHPANPPDDNSSAGRQVPQTEDPEGVMTSPVATAGKNSFGAEDARRPYTREEMLSAKPADMGRYDRTENFRYETMAGPTGPVGGTPASRGEMKTVAVDEATSVSASAAPTANLLAGFNYPYPYDRFAALGVYYTTFPYNTVGKVFYRKDNQIWVCSATSIGNYAVLTAGHCVHKGNNSATGWHTDWVFVPGYNNGNAPYGQFFYNHLRVMTGWYQSGNKANDVGGAVLNKNQFFGELTPKKVSQRVGNLGTIWNISFNQHFHALGYPGDPPFNGLTLQICSASYAANDGSLNFGVGCDMTPGSSGGPFVYKLRSQNKVNGVNSYKLIAQPLAVYSPYFNTAVGQLILCLVNSGPGVQRCSGPPAP